MRRFRQANSLFSNPESCLLYRQIVCKGLLCLSVGTYAGFKSHQAVPQISGSALQVVRGPPFCGCGIVVEGAVIQYNLLVSSAS